MSQPKRVGLRSPKRMPFSSKNLNSKSKMSLKLNEAMNKDLIS